MKNKKPQKQMNKAGENFLLKEYEVLWHYHYIEHQEAQSDGHVKFYFTLLIALAAAGGALIKSEMTANKQIASILPDVIKILAAPAVVIVLVGTVILLILTKSRKDFVEYIHAINNIRRYFKEKNLSKYLLLTDSTAHPKFLAWNTLVFFRTLLILFPNTFILVCIGSLFLSLWSAIIVAIVYVGIVFIWRCSYLKKFEKESKTLNE